MLLQEGHPFLPPARLRAHFTPSRSLSGLPLRMLTQAEIGASSLVMNTFPFLTFLELQSLPRKTRAFPGLAVGG